MDSETGAVVVSAARATELGPWPDPRQSRHSCSGAWSHTHARMGRDARARRGRPLARVDSPELGQQRSAPVSGVTEAAGHVAPRCHAVTLSRWSLYTCAVCPEPGSGLLLPGIPTNI